MPTENSSRREIDQFLGELEQRAADIDIDASETQEWLSSLDYVLEQRSGSC